MGSLRKTLLAGLMALAVSALAMAADFDWNWHNQDTIGRTDPSVNNTSRLTEPERTALIDAFVLRLQKPMSDQGYDDQRIREIASTTRLRFLDLGAGGKPFILATSLGLEGGCDALANCPFWIFRHTDDGYVSILDTDGASYTIQPTSANGVSDLVIMRHESASESHLTLYSYADGKYSDAGCYIAIWPPPKDGEAQDPAINPCKTEGSKADEPKPAEKPDQATPAEKLDETKPAATKPAEPKTDEASPAPPPAAQADESKPAQPTTDEAKPAEPKTDEAKPAQPQTDESKPDQPSPPDTKPNP